MPRPTVRAALALACAAAGLTVTTTPGATAPASDAVVRCGGKVATIVSGWKWVAGTSRNDVIVTTGRAVQVEAGAGRDTICLRGRRGAAFVMPGPGDDRVLVGSRMHEVDAILDEGRDTYVGGPGIDSVSTGADGERNRDRISLGLGDDAIHFDEDAVHHRRALVRGGAGRDVASVEGNGRLKVDATRALASVRGRTFARWVGFEDYALESHHHSTFVGSEAGESVDFSGFGSVLARTGGGDDQVHFSWTTFAIGDAAPVVDGGPGRDLLEVSTQAPSIVGDLTEGRIEAESHGDVEGLDISTFEGLSVHDMSFPEQEAVSPGQYDEPTRIELIGDAGDNHLQASACAVVLRGGAGDDDLRVGDDPRDAFGFSPGARWCRPTATVHGEAGDDVLVSAAFGYRNGGAVEMEVRDRLDGGEGTDTADAGKGVDTCVAETRIDCEA